VNRYLIAALYCLVVLVANLTAGIFIPLPVFGLLSVGTLFFGATFTLRDYAHHHGRRFVYAMIAAAAVVSAIGAIATDTPLRIIVASFVTILLAESVDTEIYQRLINRPWLQRVAGSNAASIPTDSMLFTVLAFAGTMPAVSVVAIIWADILWKYAIGMVTALVRIRYEPAPINP
jgi:uncharacterized PurR-regulated membrane protein YhhQ (DUF165 family)